MQTQIREYQERFATRTVPYDIPHESGDEGLARQDHRSWYWTLHDYASYECPDCGRGVDDVQRFEVHHIDRDPLNGALWNLIAVCRRCHGWRHGNREDIGGLALDEWKEAFIDPEFHPVY